MRFLTYSGKILAGSRDPRSLAETKKARKFDREFLDQGNASEVVGSLGGSLVAYVDVVEEDDSYLGVIYQRPAETDHAEYDYFFMNVFLGETTLTCSYLKVRDLTHLRSVLSKALKAAERKQLDVDAEDAGARNADAAEYSQDR